MTTAACSTMANPIPIALAACAPLTDFMALTECIVHGEGFQQKSRRRDEDATAECGSLRRVLRENHLGTTTDLHKSLREHQVRLIILATSEYLWIIIHGAVSWQVRARSNGDVGFGCANTCYETHVNQRDRDTGSKRSIAPRAIERLHGVRETLIGVLSEQDTKT